MEGNPQATHQKKRVPIPAVGCLVIIGAFLCFQAKLILSIPTIEDMVENFRTHQDEFESLLAMAIQDGPDTPVAESNQWPEATEIVLADGWHNKDQWTTDADRRESYHRLGSICGVQMIFAEKTHVQINTYSHGVAYAGMKMGFIWTTDSQRVEYMESDPSWTVVPFQEDWYVYRISY